VGDEKIYKMKELLDVLEKGISKGEVYITDIVIEGGFASVFVGFVVDEECSRRLIKLSLCKSTKVTIAQSN
jgi:hypothetical protein